MNLIFLGMNQQIIEWRDAHGLNHSLRSGIAEWKDTSSASDSISV